MSFFYVDSSAIVKLIWSEAESSALAEFVLSDERSAKTLITSAVSRIEVLRATRRRDGSLLSRAREVLETFSEFEITEGIMETAAMVGSPNLRTLDAIHLATAMENASGMRALITYDTRLAQAARELGLPVASPGMAA
ncbi:MAG: type II toxin-antitoxin system VapC family toxin [Pontimonas sp.]